MQWRCGPRGSGCGGGGGGGGGGCSGEEGTTRRTAGGEIEKSVQSVLMTLRLMSESRPWLELVFPGKGRRQWGQQRGNSNARDNRSAPVQAGFGEGEICSQKRVKCEVLNNIASGGLESHGALSQPLGSPVKAAANWWVLVSPSLTKFH